MEENMPDARQPKFEFFHVDYFTGDPTTCFEAPFCHVPNRDHFRTEEEARQCFEEHMSGHLIPKPFMRRPTKPENE
jgi:hypothetical protein